MSDVSVIYLCLVHLVLAMASQSCYVEAAIPKSSAKCPRSDAEVLVLGAGMAGISAAKTLSDGGITNLLILEAQEQIGGRVKNTVLSSGIRVELGANWIQGIDPQQPEKHPLWRIAEKCGGLEGRFMPTYNNGTIHVFDETGKNITDSSTFKNRLAEWKNILDPGLALYAGRRQVADIPDLSARQALQNTGWTPRSPLDDVIEWNGFDFDEYADTPEHISLYGNFPDPTYSIFGNNSINYFVTDQKEGFVKVVKCLASDFLVENDHRLHLRSTVVEVDWSSSDYVCVTTRENGALQEYCAPYAILTYSLGVLKSNTLRFVPELPTVKRKAIDTLGFALYLKIFLEFEEVFWKKEVNVVSILRVDSIRGHFVQFQPLTNTTPILFTTVTGEVAKSVYNQSTEETTALIMKGLRQIYGDDIPDPISVTIPDWWVNPLFRGTYSNIPPFRFSEIGNLQEAVGRLHFGGEATSEEYIG